MNQVIIQDCTNNRRMVYLLDEHDFSFYRINQPSLGDNTDASQLHGLIARMLTIMEMMTDQQCSDRLDTRVLQLTFYLCGFIGAIQSPYSRIELLRITRLTSSDLLYDYTASIEFP